MKKLKDNLFVVLLLVPLMIGALSFSGCHHGEYDETVKLQFSTDTLMFDTVFTTVSSITRSFTVTNPSADPVKVDIYLAGGTQSYYSINVDGVAGVEFHDVEIPAHDSIFVFVKVIINPTDQNTPYLVTDSVLFYNTQRKQAVQLVAFGQDAHFIIPDHINPSMPYRIVAHEHEHVHWTNDKPWVIYGWAVVDSLGKLTVDPGTRVYVHNGGGIWVYRYGNIHVNGTFDDPVLIAGDRLEPFYATDYEQWNRILINEGAEDNIINNAIITNSSTGIEVSALMEYLGNKTIINNSVIHNNRYYGVAAQSANVEMNNCQVSNTGSYSVVMQVGEFTLNHVTIANFYSKQKRNEPAFGLSNYYDKGDTRYLGNTNFVCNNSIIYGVHSDNYDEIITSSYAGVDLNYRFNNCIVKKDEMNGNYTNCFDRDPLFVSNYSQNYNLKENSPAIDAGRTDLGITTDILGRLRNGVPDIGAYEYYPSADEKRMRR